MTYEPGIYWGPLSRTVAGVTERGIPYVAVEFIVQCRKNGSQWEEDFDESDREARTIWFYLSDESQPYSIPQLEKIGFNGDFSDPKISPPEEWNEGIVAQCRHEMYQGVSREKWSLHGFGTGIEHKPMSADDIRRLNAIWKSKKGKTTVTDDRKRRAAPMRSPTIDKEEIPF